MEEEKTTNKKKSTPKAQKSQGSQEAQKPQKSPKNPSATAALVMSIISLVAVTGCAGYCVYDYLRGDTPITIVNSGTDGNSISNFTEGSVAEIASKVSPAVVSIVGESSSTNWFGQSSTATSAGTGMIVTSDGYVLTNKHVVSGAKKLKIILEDGTTYENVKIIGSDPSNDVAFLKIEDAKGLPTVTLGDSKTISVGQQVIAIGNALGEFQNTVSAGIISGLGRSITATSSDYSSSENLTDLIQTDAAINSGNSGGPLVNAAGEVIGINTATSAEAEAIGFSIPISCVKGMLSGLIKTGKLERSYLGVRYVNLDASTAKKYNLSVNTGAYIIGGTNTSAVITGSPAAGAGLKERDIITAVNGVKIISGRSLATLLAEYAAGDTIQLTILRGDKEMAVNVTLGAFAD